MLDISRESRHVSKCRSNKVLCREFCHGLCTTWSLFNCPNNYLLSGSVDHNDWARSLFVEVESSPRTVHFEEEEELSSIANDRTLKSKRAERNLDSFWILVEQECMSIAQKALQYSTSCLCKFRFSVMTTIRRKKQ